MTNPYGDIELDARGMRVLAHPVRLRALNELQRHGPSTATLLSRVVGADEHGTGEVQHLSHGPTLAAAPRRPSDLGGSGRSR